ncbi:hypothetical protein [Cupriavidus basilensis]|uniref:hypothetical protein n=1 Tax=Cupriavidus basilensis TaxID=68895 RepID=UPI003F5B5670
MGTARGTEYSFVAGKGPPGRFNTYATPVAGVGVRIKGGINAWWPQEYYYAERKIQFVGGERFTVELVKTGPITAAGN